MHPRNLGMVLQEARYSHGRFALAPDTNFERLEAADQEVAAIGAHGTAKMNHGLANLFDPPPAPGYGPRDNVGMAAQIFGRAMKNQVKAHVQRLLQDRRAERAVNQGNQLVFAS